MMRRDVKLRHFIAELEEELCVQPIKNSKRRRQLLDLYDNNNLRHRELDAPWCFV